MQAVSSQSKLCVCLCVRVSLAAAVGWLVG